jgi:hypothetical protein
MQAVAVVTGDEFLLTYNLSLGTEDLLSYIDEIKYNFESFHRKSYIVFDDYHGVDVAPIAAPSGICYNFNMIDSEVLFNLDM